MQPSAEPTDRLVVRFRVRSGSDRINPRTPEPFELECGYELPTAKDEKGRMVNVLLGVRDQIPEALHILADLWARACDRDATLRRQGIEPILFDVPPAPIFIMPLEATRLADKLHELAKMLREPRIKVATFDDFRRATHHGQPVQ